MLDRLHVDQGELQRYLVAVETRYNSSVIYHNELHATDILQAVHSLLCATALQSSFTDLEVFSLLLAAIIHDIDHPSFLLFFIF